MFRGKNYKESAKLIDKQTAYDPAEAFDLVCKASKAKFDETVELHVKLGVDGRLREAGRRLGFLSGSPDDSIIPCQGVRIKRDM